MLLKEVFGIHVWPIMGEMRGDGVFDLREPPGSKAVCLYVCLSSEPEV